jgi:glycosyltransferase involved in cell wall biosynthesis
MTDPRVLIGVPLYNGERYLEAAVESLLEQTFTDFDLLLLDDHSSDRTPEVARHLAASDPRVRYERNRQRLGLVGAWNRALELCAAKYPNAQYFAWGSDHDLWDRRWLEALSTELDCNDDVVLCYPLRDCINDDGDDMGVAPRFFETHGVHDRLDRLRLTVGGMSAGNMIYGLFRLSALLRVTPLRLTILPDRLLLSDLSLEGGFRQVPETLWHRRYREGEVASVGRQRRSIYPHGAPIDSYVPWCITHSSHTARKLLTERRQIDRSRIRIALAIKDFVRQTVKFYLAESPSWRRGRSYARDGFRYSKRVRRRVWRASKRRWRSAAHVVNRLTHTRLGL